MRIPAKGFPVIYERNALGPNGMGERSLRQDVPLLYLEKRVSDHYAGKLGISIDVNKWLQLIRKRRRMETLEPTPLRPNQLSSAFQLEGGKVICQKFGEGEVNSTGIRNPSELSRGARVTRHPIFSSVRSFNISSLVFSSIL